jgi:hypothetical protein
MTKPEWEPEIKDEPTGLPVAPFSYRYRITDEMNRADLFTDRMRWSVSYGTWVACYRAAWHTQRWAIEILKEADDA